jgi:glycosyltransferase involved in cell wall biosynthesis
MQQMTTSMLEPEAALCPFIADPKRLLIVSYTFPPVGGAGVQRVAKFVKYLGRHGWLPSVLTVANPSVPACDESLVGDIPKDVVVRKARTWEPSYRVKSALSATGSQPEQGLGRAWGIARDTLRRLTNLCLQPDPQVLWMPGAVREGLRLLNDIPHHAILASGPPFSTFLIGAKLSRLSGLPLVLDYRDEWDLAHAHLENKRGNFLSRYVQSRMQRNVMRAAQALVATTRCSAQSLDALRESAGCNARVTWIYNGFDPDDFPPEPRSSSCSAERYRLAYVGTLWNMTSVEPLVLAVEELARRRPALLNQLELVFAGRRTAPQQQLLDRLQALPCRIVELPYVDHRRAIDLIRSANALCLLLSDLAGSERVVPAKLFEYMAARRDILAIAPKGEVCELLQDYPNAQRFSPKDTDGLARWLAQEIEHKSAMASPHSEDWDGTRYDRCNQARQLVELLESMLFECINAQGAAHSSFDPMPVI